MAQFELRGVLAIAVLAMLNSAGPLAAQSERKSAPKDSPDYAICPDGNHMPRFLDCPNEHRACPTDSYSLGMPYCPQPVTSRCPGKILVPYGTQCPKSDELVNNPSNVVKQASPKSNPAKWVPHSAYPRDALRDGIEGRVGFTLAIGPNGKPSRCQITRSSGNDSLDWATCDSLMRRASFKPAKDAEGKPIASTYSNMVRWIIPGYKSNTDPISMETIKSQLRAQERRTVSSKIDSKPD